MRKNLRRVLGLVALGICCHEFASRAQPAGDGLYAGFITTQGTFWCRLEFQRAPRTVANFVGLAEGTRDWIHFESSRIVRRKFYDGLFFHRVIDKFVIQGGSPNGLGTDGPGYQFADEFHPELKHSKPGILSMANSGKNSNGSQFFVTVTNTPHLDGIHSIFGEVVEGMEVVFQISKVATDVNDRPVTPVVMQEVRIARQGPAAEAFDPGQVTPPLPDVGQVPIALKLDAGSMRLLISPRPTHFLHLFASSDLAEWAVGSSRSMLTNIDVGLLLGAPYETFPAIFLHVLDGGYEP